MTDEPRPSLLSSCIALLDRLALFSDKVTKTFREASKTLKEAQAAYQHSAGVWERFIEVCQAVRDLFGPGSRTAEA